MKGLSVEKAFHTATEAFQNCLKRFPVTVTFIFVFTAYLIYLTYTDWKGEDRLLFIIGYYLSVGILLSLTLHLWSEEVKNRLWKTGINLAAHALLIADAFLLYHYLTTESSWIEIGIAHAAAILAVGLSTFFLSFLREKNDIASWNFALNTVSAYIVTQVIGLILCAGISLLLFSLHQLFDIHISGKCYAYIYYLCNVSLGLMLFLGLLPQGNDKHNREPHSSEFLNGILHYLFLPLTAGYLIVLYIYATRILISWELPIGWVSWLIVALMTVCIAVQFGLYPTRFKEGKRFDNWIARWMPVLILPLLLLMTIGIIRRFNDYGITINRLYLATLNGWFYIVCIGLFVIKARRINWIPISFAGIFLLTSALPVNYAGITKNTILKEIKAEMQRSCRADTPLSLEQYKEWIYSLPEKQAIQINGKFRYLSNWFGTESVTHLIDKDVTYNLYSVTADIDTDTIATDTDSDRVTYSGEIDSQTIINIPAGYTRFIAIPDAGLSGHRFTIPRQYLGNGTLPVSLDTRTGNLNDSVYIELSTLEMLEKSSKHGHIPPTSFRCNSPKNLFMLTAFDIHYEKSSDEDVRMSIKGYLFKK
ncbi:conserved domain protein [Bacteroides clarus CAG:160]|uniref:DUF4153 domain-containing protein n=1 Tax=Bacteroides TaxID=816 RepID=UPI000335A3CC|nr:MULTISPECIES: DUF4153 domain-containing protein [Bacteroides]CDB83075.1 conserved domain protein [Bacteroides clarus CAG:160]